MNQKKLVEAARRLVALVDDPQPGLVTWNVACGEASAQIREAFAEESDEGHASIETLDDGRILLAVGIHGEPPVVRMRLSVADADKLAEGLKRHVRKPK